MERGRKNKGMGKMGLCYSKIRIGEWGVLGRHGAESLGKKETIDLCGREEMGKKVSVIGGGKSKK